MASSVISVMLIIIGYKEINIEYKYTHRRPNSNSILISMREACS